MLLWHIQGQTCGHSIHPWSREADDTMLAGDPVHHRPAVGTRVNRLLGTRACRDDLRLLESCRSLLLLLLLLLCWLLLLLLLLLLKPQVRAHAVEV